MRIRTIKPAFWKNESLSGLEKADRLLAVALLNYADDEGYFQAHESLVRGECFPFDEDSTQIRGGLAELSRIGFLALGTSADGQRIGRVVNFLEHQRIDKPSKSKFSALTIAWDDGLPLSRKPLGIVVEPSTPEVEEEGKRKGKVRMSPLPEDFAISDRVLKWATQRGLAGVIELHFEAFVSTCRAKGYSYADWDEAFMNAVRKNWAKIEVPRRDASGRLKVAV